MSQIGKSGPLPVNDVKPQSILVTGGAGYVGSRISAHLFAADYAVTVFDKLVYGGEALLPFHGHEGSGSCAAMSVTRRRLPRL